MSRVLTPSKTEPVERSTSLSPTAKAGDGVDSQWQATRLQRICRDLLASRLSRINAGTVSLCDPEFASEFGAKNAPGEQVRITVRDPRCYTRIALGGSLGAAEAYVRGYWDTEDLTAALCLFARNAEALKEMDRWGAQWLRPFRAVWMWSRRNSRAGSRRNITAHYDLSNEFFALMLDPTMTYSGGIFDHAGATLEQASIAKYDRICRKLKLRPHHHLLEIGTGWGGFAIHAARNYGCRVTTTTISRQQFDLAQTRIRADGLADRVELRRDDYRDLRGRYDRLVSIEMIEAVGRQHFDTYFGRCSSLLQPDGIMLLQAITIPDERYDAYRRSVDFINRYIFPGGFLPSFSAISQSLRRSTDFRLVHCEDFGSHYARTLACWRANFQARLDQVRKLRFDERFIRTWNYYLSYCEAGFSERQIGVSQIMLTKPACRIPPVFEP